MTRRLATLLLLAVAAGAGGGCSMRILAPTAADSAREQVAAHAETIARLEARQRELEGEVRALREALADRPDAGVDPEAEAARPRLAALGLGRGSVVRRTGDGAAEMVLYIEPRDGRGRFLQIVGTLTAQLAVLGIGSEPVVLGEWSYPPVRVRDAWRSGFMGTHYTIMEAVPLPEEAASEASVLIRFDDAIDGERFELLRAVPVLGDSRAVRSEAGR
jgi:hypothetical protein